MAAKYVHLVIGTAAEKGSWEPRRWNVVVFGSSAEAEELASCCNSAATRYLEKRSSEYGAPAIAELDLVGYNNLDSFHPSSIHYHVEMVEFIGRVR